ncbi:response regulator [Maribacter sp. X9]|uniref:response regulator n=1 Tax=Maribacter sp. X9 TaxID=3402159 RepID=UPI003AF3E81F
MKNQVLNYRRVIVVDDNRVDLFLNTLLVKKLNIAEEVVSFEKPLQALGYLRTLAKKRTDNILLLLDLNMPDISGFEFLEALPPMIDQLECFDVLIVTSSIDCEDRNKAYSNPLVNDFLIKPLRLEELNHSIGLRSTEVNSKIS